MGGRDEKRSRGPRPQNREVHVSKAMSKLLRHQLDSSRIARLPGGYISVKDMLEYTTIKSLKVTFDEVKTIVVENDKQRFSLIPRSALEEATTGSGVDSAADDEQTIEANLEGITLVSDEGMSDRPQDYLIRAKQGHSIKIASEDLLKPLEAADAPEMVVHGTVHGAWPLIVETGGLKTMGRVHIHFAPGLPAGLKPMMRNDVSASASNNEAASSSPDTSAAAAAPVISGMRNSSTILIYLDIQKALSAGIKFWTSENGVILTEGDERGIVGIEFFKRVEDRTDGLGVFCEDGKVIKETPDAWRSKGTVQRRGNKGQQQQGQQRQNKPRKPQLARDDDDDGADGNDAGDHV